MTVEDDGRTLSVMVMSGGCDGTPRLRASEAPHTVSLTVRIPSRTGADVVCRADARLGPVRATLHSDLGPRTVNDGTTGRRLPVHGR
ncbi:hypothetical protein ACF073_11460 [Streptomyces sp. NPDC015171]|uniref:hypothetical protein n=1 Tax=Streptomyces sp. NPDC015171 TaxID=3364945 RepID=UPI0036F9BD96